MKYIKETIVINVILHLFGKYPEDYLLMFIEKIEANLAIISQLF